jgi:hypothetical protein
MKKRTAGIVACALAVSLIVLPGGASAEAKAGASAAQAPAPYKPRIRIFLSTTFPLAAGGNKYNAPSAGSFFFPGDFPILDKGPHPGQFSHVQSKGLRDLYYGPLGLAYDWSENYSAEIELIASGRSREAWSYALMEFTSPSDGLTFHAYYQPGAVTSFVSVLFGLTYRTKTPTAYERHAFEVGAALGPAFGTLGIDAGTVDLLSEETVRKTALSARVHGGYSFLILPTLSVGAILGYRSLEMSFAGSTHSSEVAFSESGGSGGTAFTRTTEITLPGRTIRWTGFFFGLGLDWRIR